MQLVPDGGGKYEDDPELRAKAMEVFDMAIERGWDKEYGGLLYFVDCMGFPPEAYEHDMKLWWPHNEILMEYSCVRRLRAGFSKVVFIIKPEMEEMMRRLCGDYLARKTALDGTPVEVAYVFQDFTSVPDFYRIPPERTKPFGTVHALLCAADVVHEPSASSMPTTITASTPTAPSMTSW
mgnify:CR=1 FL=1